MAMVVDPRRSDFAVWYDNDPSAIRKVRSQD